VADLSRDTDNAHSALNQIFDKEKEQNRVKEQQLLGEIGVQVIDITRTHAKANATEKAKADFQGKKPTEAEFNQRVEKHLAESGFGTGGKYTRAMQAATAAVQGLMNGDLNAALANGAAPFIASEIKNLIPDDDADANLKRTIAHGIANAALALAKGENAAAQATGAMTGEAIGILAESIYKKQPGELTEQEKDNISAWATLASGLAGGLVGGDTQSAANSAQAGKTTVENNALSDIVEAQAAGKTPQKVAEERVNAEIERYRKENCAGMSAGACSAKMAEDRDKFFKAAASLGIDLVPGIGDFKSFAEADDWIDYTLAAAGTLPFAKVFTKPLKEAKLLLKAGDLDGANKLIKEASDGIPTKLPSSPTSQSSSGVWKPDHGVEVNAGSGKQKDSQIWTETKKADPVSNAYGHWDKHKSEFPEFQNSKQYVDAAHDFVNTPPKGTLIKERANGDTMYYNPTTNTFAVKNADGTPKTMFKPQSGIEYWEKQK
ncbi:TPA: VENN motif pre-toxin domain-containing protein, partial [Proteus mirabilis]|nr:VENN motif pre-toxin domain-containing protein [Proteus mirabilis]